ncbi:MAG: hypothetical protein J1G06_04560 [Oscillospiraceae bacterium]|nr:hypothetical protein [Oscillospiraceae bacterium]
MQNTISFELNGKKYVSKPFDFEAFCLINEAHVNTPSKYSHSSIYRVGGAAIDHMFEGTEATQEIIDELSIPEKAKLAHAAWKIYAEEIKNV